MNTIELIRAEIERRKKEIHATVFNDEFDDLLRFLDTLEQSEESVDADREEIIGLSIMAYLETHLKHDKSVVLRGVNKADAREWIRRQIAREKSEKPINLMAEIKQYYWDNFDLISSDNPTLDIVTHIARHFFELGRNAK